MVAPLFYSGDHRGVLEKTLDRPEARYAPSDFPFIVGALIYLGRLNEAERLYKLKNQLLDIKALTKSRYFLALGFCRHSYYEKSREYLVENFKVRRIAVDSESQFFIFQGLGFYHYFAGRMAKALKNAEKAQAAALNDGFLYGRALSMDLRGHTLIQTGFVGQGFEALKLAEALATKLGAEWLSDAIGVSLVSYRARFGIKPQSTSKEIHAKLNSLSQQDIYSQTSLLLDLAQDHIRRGNLSEARQVLNECCRIVYGLNNRRHAALLNLRYAYLHYLEGDPHLSLNLLRNALTQIHPKVDILLELKLRGLEERLIQELKFEKCTKSQQMLITCLTSRVREVVGRRIISRKERLPLSSNTLGEDPFGDLMDTIYRDGTQALDRIFESGYLGLLSDIFPETRGKRLLYLDLEPHSLTVFDKGNIEHYPGVVSRSTRALLMNIQNGQHSKAELIESVWKYEYHPLRHDALIYSSVAKIRKLLGKRSHWVEVSENGYSLRPEVSVVPYEAYPVPVEVPVKPRQDRSPSLNHRQQKILRFLEQNETIDSMTVRGLFETSEITASRDLAELVRLQLVTRIGKGRATKYLRERSIL